jgi:hypothetical protein
LALLTSNVAAADAIEQMAQDTGIFELVHRGSAVAATNGELRQLCSVGPDVILLHISLHPSSTN